MVKTIPDNLRVLDPYLPRWAIPYHGDRIKARLAATIEELTELQEKVLPHIPIVVKTLNSYPLTDIPAELRPYGHLVLTVAAYDLAVNRFKRVDVPYSYPLEKLNYICSSTGKDWD